VITTDIAETTIRTDGQTELTDDQKT